MLTGPSKRFHTLQDGLTANGSCPSDQRSESSPGSCHALLGNPADPAIAGSSKRSLGCSRHQVTLLNLHRNERFPAYFPHCPHPTESVPNGHALELGQPAVLRKPAGRSRHSRQPQSTTRVPETRANWALYRFSLRAALSVEWYIFSSHGWSGNEADEGDRKWIADGVRSAC